MVLCKFIVPSYSPQQNRIPHRLHTPHTQLIPFPACHHDQHGWGFSGYYSSLCDELEFYSVMLDRWGRDSVFIDNISYLFLPFSLCSSNSSFLPSSLLSFIYCFISFRHSSPASSPFLPLLRFTVPLPPKPEQMEIELNFPSLSCFDGD